MPSNKTHRPIGGAGAAVTCAVIGLPIAWWLVPIAAATRAGAWPDKLEKVPRALWRRVRPWELRAGVRLAAARLSGTPATGWRARRDRGLVKLDRLLRRLQVHRRWTHYIGSTGVALAVLTGAAAAGALVGVLTLGLLLLQGVAPDHAATMPAEAWTYATWVGAFAALGVFVGVALHSYFDGWTELGSPMAGPWCKRRLHVVPKIVARHRARRGQEPWLNDEDEATIRKWCPRVIAASVAAHYHAAVWTACEAAYHLARAALAG
jgi:hypothetical protein